MHAKDIVQYSLVGAVSTLYVCIKVTDCSSMWEWLSTIK